VIPATAPGAALVGLASAVPPWRDQRAMWDGFFAEHFAGNRWAAKVFLSAGPRRRHPVVDPTVEDVSGWTTGQRMARYVPEALPLGKRALSGALSDAGMAAEDVGLLVVVSCTGYATPGLDIHLARDLGMGDDVQRLVVGHMGCYAALPALGAARDFVVARRRSAVVLSVELSSLHVQPPTTDLEQVVAHALFSDAAAAVVLRPDGGDGAGGAGTAGVGLSVLGVAARTEAATAGHMTWDVTDRGFRMTLSRRVPDVVGRHVAPLVDGLLSEHGLTRGDVAAWAVHPGGPRIVEVVADRLGLSEPDVAASQQVLADHGNCSSATILLILEELRARRAVPPGGHVVALAFGPGLTLYGALLRAGDAT